MYRPGCQWAEKGHVVFRLLRRAAPADWQFEQFPLPPTFAPTVRYKGLEELRFSPDMFKKDAPNYFTYGFAARFDNTPSVSPAEISGYLLTYFKGLYSKGAAGPRRGARLPPVHRFPAAENRARAT